MPGRRNLQRERARHRAAAPAQCAALHALLRSQLPQHDRVLIGQAAILRYLRELGVRRRNTAPLTWRIVERWRHTADCPILRGNRSQRQSGVALSTSFALTAWLLTRFNSADLFRIVANPLEVPTMGSFTASAQTAEVQQPQALAQLHEACKPA